MIDDENREIEDSITDLGEDLNPQFNPKDIDIAVELRSLDSIISRIQNHEVDMNTHFQRKGDLWPDAVMSRLIESILIRFPLPAFYFDATDDDNWLIVDGLQRLSAIRKFVLNVDFEYVNNERSYTDLERQKGRNKPLKLSGLEYLTDYNGFTFNELPNPLKRRIRESQVTVYLIKPGTPEEVKYSIFYRINTGGLQLNAQEIRHALNQYGISVSYLEEIAESEIFKKVVKISDKRMQDRELVLRYLAFSLVDRHDYKPSMLRFLNETMTRLNYLEREQLRLQKLKFHLEQALQTSYYLFGEAAFSKSIVQGYDAKGPLNRALFEVWTTVLGKLMPWELDNLQEFREDLLTDYIHLLQYDNQFDKSISSQTTGYSNVQYRFNAIEKIIYKYVNRDL